MEMEMQMKDYWFRCKECGAIYKISAETKDKALDQLKKWTVCLAGKHPVLLTMREATEDVEVTFLRNSEKQTKEVDTAEK
jgi:hypothetical protein